MNELRRMAYLDALGIDSYVSRKQLPGAAVTRRLAIVKRPATASPAAKNVDVPDATTSGVGPVPPAYREGFTRPDFGLDTRAPRIDAEPAHSEPSRADEPVPRFTLTAIVAGDWLWLDELQGMPLTTDQVRLVQAMAQALRLSRASGSESVGAAAGTPVTRPEVTQFEWPMHTNRQLDLGEEAARASVAAFVSRRLEQCGCRGLILLGQSCAARVPMAQVTVPAVTTASSAEILASPALKRQVWRDLQALLQQA
mgnify:FL=1|tara:strand:+ start:3635 stop:4396 length:762 start_codon:yes stop_codon:yes gene_type:complete